MTAVISCHGVSKTFPGPGVLPTLTGIDVTIRTGEFVALLGPSGCGKSTFLMMVAGLEPVEEGVIAIEGVPVSGPRPDIGIVFQDPTLLPWKTALDNVLFPVEMMQRPRAAYVDRAQALLRQTGLGEATKRRPNQLSGGMRQRVAICRALVTDPEILLMDEPFSALDALTRDDVNLLMLDLWEKHHKTAIFVTHSIREAVLLADRVLVMGGSPATILDDVQVPFPRPRDIALTETAAFNQLCARLRLQVASAHRNDAQLGALS